MIRLHHVNVVCLPGEAAVLRDFYCEVLGLAPIAKPGGDGAGNGAWLAINDASQVHISERDDAGRHPDAHFALVVDDFTTVLDRLAGAGAPWTEQEDLFGGRRGFTRDPVGNRIELCERAGELA